MNSQSFQVFKTALKSGVYDDLKKIKHECDPYISEQIDYMSEEVNFNTQMDVGKFIRSEYSKDELIVTFLLFLAKQFNIEKIKHIFYEPYTDCIFYWYNILKYTTFTLVTLIYDKNWSSEDFVLLDEMMLEINTGKPEAIRLFLNKVLNKNLDVFDAERLFVYNRRLSSEEFGPFYWRIIHLMAEAMQSRKESFAKQFWREYVVYVLPKTLRCGACASHYLLILDRYKKDLLESDDYVNLWFKIHNEVNKASFSESEFEKEREYMKKILL